MSTPDKKPTPEDRFAGLTPDKMAYGHKSDIEVATMVRMMLRSDLEHEGICVAARDRIMFLHWELRRARELLNVRPLEEWTEEDGYVLWWAFPISEPPYVGTPLDTGSPVEVTIRDAVRDYTYTQMIGGWPGYHTHWSPLPRVAAPVPVPHVCEKCGAEGWNPCDRRDCQNIPF